MYARVNAFVVAWLLVILITLPKSDAYNSNNNNDNDGHDEFGFTQLVGWVNSHGGYVNDSFDMKKIDGVRGGVAVNDIETGTELLRSPWEIVIGSSSFENQMQTQDMCNVVEEIANELQLGKDSNWYFYLMLHHDNIMNMSLPALWGPVALQLLQGLPPRQEANHHIRWLEEDCGQIYGLDNDNGHNVILREALVLFVTRATAVGMVPIYDLFNHHNGKRNAKLHVTDYGAQLITLEPIKTGNQIYISYGVKSAPTFLNNYGFVESWPQIWAWTDVSKSDSDNNGGRSNSHTLAFLEGKVAIYPNKEFLKEFWRSSGSSIKMFQDLAIQQNLKLSEDIISIFELSVRNLLDSLPTTVEEDVVILKGMNDNLLALQTMSTVSRTSTVKSKIIVSDSNSNDDDIIVVKDSIAAVEYRIKFKDALQAGFDEVATLRMIVRSEL